VTVPMCHMKPSARQLSIRAFTIGPVDETIMGTGVCHGLDAASILVGSISFPGRFSNQLPNPSQL